MTFRMLPRAAFPLAAVLVTTCGDPSGPSREALAAMMLGEWTHARRPSAPVEAPSLNAGLFVSITIDSARGVQFWGRVTRWSVGDVGLPANRFGPVSGTLDSAYGVVLQIAPGSAPSTVTFRVEGRVQDDRLLVLSSWADAEPGPFPAGCQFQRLH